MGDVSLGGLQGKKGVGKKSFRFLKIKRIVGGKSVQKHVGTKWVSPEKKVALEKKKVGVRKR